MTIRRFGQTLFQGTGGFDHLLDREPGGARNYWIPVRPPLDEDREADIRFGGPSDFPYDPVNNIGINVGGFNTKKPDPPPDVIEYNETERNTDKIRVENPDDSEQYVMVERINDITFQGPDEKLYKFILNNN